MLFNIVYQNFVQSEKGEIRDCKDVNYKRFIKVFSISPGHKNC